MAHRSALKLLEPLVKFKALSQKANDQGCGNAEAECHKPKGVQRGHDATDGPSSDCQHDM